MLEITASNACKQEFCYICKLLMSDFLGLEYNLFFSNEEAIVIRSNGKTLTLSNTFFHLADQYWLKEQSMPVQPLSSWNVEQLNLPVVTVNSNVPVIYGDNSCYKDLHSISLGLDIFGSSFFMLSRYEEVVQPETDQHDRFPATASLAFQEKFLDRPVINEYLEILWACIKYLWPQLVRKTRDFQMQVTCDVDHPYSPTTKNLKKLVLQIGENLLVRKNLKLGVMNGFNYVFSKTGNYQFDPCNSFDWMMTECEKNNVMNSFYFITDQVDKKFDGTYSMNEPFIRSLLRSIHNRGHRIGLHTSYHTYLDNKQTKLEFETLLGVCEQEKIKQDSWGGRQHYLRWKTSETFQNWSAAGLDYDSTLSFADQSGFRCGICFEYKVYDVLNRVALELTERPLIVMECSVISKRYMNLGYTEQALEMFLSYKNRCRMFNGDFTFLWHNSFFNNPEDKYFYQTILSH